MSTPSQVFNAVKTRLEADNTLAGYIKQFLQGERELATITQYPTLVIDYGGSQETDNTYGSEKINMSVSISIIINITDKDKQIVGDTNTKGVLDILNDIKKAIDADRTLGGVAIFTRIPSDNLTTVDFPVRVITITLDILFSQTESVRT